MREVDWRQLPRNRGGRKKGQLLEDRQRDFIKGRLKRGQKGYDQVKQQIRRIYREEFAGIFTEFLKDSWLLNDYYVMKHEKDYAGKDKIDEAVRKAAVQFATDSRAVNPSELPIVHRIMDNSKEMEGAMAKLFNAATEPESKYRREVEMKFQRKRFRKAKAALLFLEEITLHQLRSKKGWLVMNERVLKEGDSPEGFSADPRILGILKQNGLIGGETKYGRELRISDRGAAIATRLRYLDREEKS